ncbi:MAG: hypothetical protein ACI308_06745 [Muribaculaceae bacterium]
MAQAAAKGTLRPTGSCNSPRQTTARHDGGKTWLATCAQSVATARFFEPYWRQRKRPSSTFFDTSFHVFNHILTQKRYKIIKKLHISAVFVDYFLVYSKFLSTFVLTFHNSLKSKITLIL